MESIILPIKPTNGNDGRGRKWYRSSDVRKKIEKILSYTRRKPFTAPVRVTLVRILGPRESYWDPSSVLRGNSKELLDALVKLGWFRDDSMKWIVQPVIGVQDNSRRDVGPVWEIRIEDGSASCSSLEFLKG